MSLNTALSKILDTGNKIINAKSSSEKNIFESKKIAVFMIYCLLEIITVYYPEFIDAVDNIRPYALSYLFAQSTIDAVSELTKKL